MIERKSQKARLAVIDPYQLLASLAASLLNAVNLDLRLHGLPNCFDLFKEVISVASFS